MGDSPVRTRGRRAGAVFALALVAGLTLVVPAPLAAQAATIQIAGTVTDGDGHPVGDVSVDISDFDSGQAIAHASTDAAGNYSAPIQLNAVYTYRFTPPFSSGLRPLTYLAHQETANGGRVLNAILQANLRTLTGTVTDKNGLALPGETVNLYDRQLGESWIATTTTNAQGGYTLTVPEGNPYLLGVRGGKTTAAAYVPEEFHVFQVVDLSHDLTRDITVRAVAFTVNVVSTNDAPPAVPVRTSFGTRYGGDLSPFPFSTNGSGEAGMTDASGSARFLGIAGTLFTASATGQDNIDGYGTATANNVGATTDGGSYTLRIPSVVPAPTALTGANPTGRAPVLHWNAVAGPQPSMVAAKYTVYRNGTAAGTSTTTTFTDADAPAGVHTYAVSATNSVGNEGPLSTTVSVATSPATVPAPPPIASVTPGNHSATITWLRPADGGTPILGYTVTASPGAQSCSTASADALTCTITGLTNGVDYTFTVTARNAVGTSPPPPPGGGSGPGTPIGTGTPGTPPAPVGGVDAVRDPADGTRVTLHWLAAASDLPITGYRAGAEPGGRSCTTGGELSCTITGLTPGVDYSFTVVAINGLGSSGPSDPVELPGDTVAPTVTGTADRPANAAGWYRAPVTITWTATDPAPSSGPATTPPSTTVSTEGAGQFAVSGRSCDPAANCATGAYGPVGIDTTPPTVTIVGAVDAATYALSQLPAPSCATSDALSGVHTAASLTSTRDAQGGYTVTCSGGTDNAGNTASPAAIGYRVTPTTGDLATLTNQYVTGSGSPNSDGVSHDLDSKLAHHQICLYIGKVNGETSGPHPTLTAVQAAELTYWARILDPTC